ncbi:TetR/AcrR family transcriptional regulator [Streptomyces sp. NPDC101455]|uniref:TetR/AcrR family transcriptional regulator n=1 Tax=Streptomyces sp. NPDC101455 TaxID=3366142 RepID=UPI00380AC3EC
MLTPAPSQRPSATQRRKPGLRERKKAKTRTIIQARALRLFTEQGYAATTVEHVAAAADVSPSTVFRYFPTKTDLVLSHNGCPPSALDALRHLAAGAGGSTTDAASEQPQPPDPPEATWTSRNRWRLIHAVPELRTALLSTFHHDVQRLADHLAHRTGQQPSAPCLRADAGALLGVLLAVALNWAEGPDTEPAPDFDEALHRVAHGVPSASLALTDSLGCEGPWVTRTTETPAKEPS